ncbi:MAG TPA: helix-hairpin-helix domain-containing protein [Polyangiales bacterium]
MHTTHKARHALVALLGLVGVAALARQGELRWAARAHEPTTEQAREAVGGEGDRLRDGKPIDLNRASPAELELLPGIGPKLARDIVEARTKRGRFPNVDALDGVRGVGPKKLARLRPFLRVE